MRKINLNKNQLSKVHKVIEENVVKPVNTEQLIKNYKDTIINLDISIACLLDEFSDIKRKDIEHLQNLITKLFILQDRKENNDLSK
tara:strand:+ start:205 stop:462 length:258 start_codon:yes stop_codon:yes gene_type:complete